MPSIVVAESLAFSAERVAAFAALLAKLEDKLPTTGIKEAIAAPIAFLPTRSKEPANSKELSANNCINLLSFKVSLANVVKLLVKSEKAAASWS